MSFKTDPLIPSTTWVPEPRVIVRHDHWVDRHTVWEKEKSRLLGETLTAAAKAIAAFRGGWTYNATQHANRWDLWLELYVTVAGQAPRYAGAKQVAR